MAVIVCVNRLYGKAVKTDIGTAATCLGCLVMHSMMEEYGFKVMLVLASYLIVGIYCVFSRKDSVKGAALSVALMVIVIAVMQFVYMLPLNALLNDVDWKVFVVNLLVLASFLWIFPKKRLRSLRRMADKYNGFAIVMLGIGLYGILLLLMQEILNDRLSLSLAMFLVFAVALSFLAVEKWNEVQREKECMEKELCAAETLPAKYEELLKAVRMRQHEFKNHLAAILATQYTYKSYDKLVKAQKEYCGRLLEENRHHDLLRIENRVLAGFLYGKVCEIESEGRKIDCRIKGTFRQSAVPIHHLIEMLAILLDNAAQAADVLFCFLEEEKDYQFQVCNRFQHVSYREIEEWFQMGKSTKGEGRGIGLYHIKCLCEEFDCMISCRNVEVEGENWIEFILRVQKADREP